MLSYSRNGFRLESLQLLGRRINVGSAETGLVFDESSNVDSTVGARRPHFDPSGI
jgi:hypothetical protein